MTDSSFAELLREPGFADIVIDGIPGVFYVLDSQGRFLRWNRLLEEVTGLTGEMLRGTDALRTIFADDQPLVADKIREVFEKGLAEVDARLLGKDGPRSFWFTGRRLDVGPISYLVGSGVDITDRKRAEQAVIRLNEQRLIATERECRALETARRLEIQKVIGAILHDSMESIPLQQFLERALDQLLAVSWLNLESHGAIFLMEGNPSILRLKAQRGLSLPLLNQCARVPLGTCLCGRAALKGQIVFAPRVDDDHERVYSDMRPHGHYCIPMHSADQVIGVITCYLPEGYARNTEDERFLTAVADVLASTVRRKQAEDSLRESEERFALAVRGTDAGIWDWDLRTNRVHFSPRWKSMLGYEEHEIADEFHVWERLLHPDDRPRALETIQGYLKGDTSEYELEHRLRHKNGSYRWILARGASVRDENHLPYRMVGSHLDITEKKQATEALREREAQLLAAQRIQELLLPQFAPTLPGFDIAGACHPAEFAAGDYFDYPPMVDDTLGLLIADVTGHGFAPALLMSAVQSHLRALVEIHAELDVILHRVNTWLVERTDQSRLVTLFFAKIDPISRTLTYVNAGHPPGYVLDKAGNLKSKLDSTAVVLGVLADVEFTVNECGVLESGDILLLLTDGVLEAFSPNGIPFGVDRALGVVRDHRGGTAREIVDVLYREVLAFSQRSLPRDDVTVVVVKVQGEF